MIWPFNRLFGSKKKQNQPPRRNHGFSSPSPESYHPPYVPVFIHTESGHHHKESDKTEGSPEAPSDSGHHSGSSLHDSDSSGTSFVPSDYSGGSSYDSGGYSSGGSSYDSGGSSFSGGDSGGGGGGSFD
jgi:hypothetical protein